MKVLNILLNLIETVTELNGLKYVDGKCRTYFEPCYTAKIECLKGVKSITVKIPTFFQAIRYNNALHVSEATFVSLVKKYMATVSTNTDVKVIKSDMKKLQTICYSDISLVLWLDAHLSCGAWSEWVPGFNNPIDRSMFKQLDNPFKSEMYYQMIHDSVDYYSSHECLSEALRVHESENTSEEQKRKIEIERSPNGYPSNIMIFFRNHYMKAATASRIGNIRNWKYLKNDDIFVDMLNNCSNDKLFTKSYDDIGKFTYYDKLCEDTFEDIIGEIITSIQEKTDNLNNYEAVNTTVSENWVQVICSDNIDKTLCATVCSTRTYLMKLDK